MSISNDIRTKLIATAGVSALVSTRVYPIGNVPEKVTAPYITVQVISDIPFSAMGADTGTSEATVQVKAHGEDNVGLSGSDLGGYVSAENVADAVKAALVRWRGAGATQTIKGCYQANYVDAYAEDAKLNETILHFKVLYS